MSSIDLTAGQVMGKSASLLNDSAQTVYTNTALLPYLQLGIQELQEFYELHNLPVTEEVSAVIQVDAGQTEIIFNGVGVPTLPDDLVEPKQLWERVRNVDPWYPMTKRDFLPHELEGQPTSQFIFYSWQTNKIKLLESNQDNDIKIDYIRELFTEIANENTAINVINARSFLEFRCAALAAEFIERNITSATALNGYGALALERATGIAAKGTQNIFTRRRPFRASYKRQGWFT